MYVIIFGHNFGKYAGFFLDASDLDGQKNLSPMTNSRSAPVKPELLLGEWAGVSSTCPFSWNVAILIHIDSNVKTKSSQILKVFSFREQNVNYSSFNK